MGTRQNVVDGRLVYTCNCGWIDTDHAAPRARGMWITLNNEDGKPVHGHRDFFEIHYKEMLGPLTFAEGRYYVRKGLSLAQKQSVALAIFREVSHEFESRQSMAPNLPQVNRLRDSGFSVEDLVSNHIGFYHAVTNRPTIPMCRPVSPAEGVRIWDRGLLGHDYHEIKNYEHTPFPGTVSLPCHGCQGQPRRFPAYFGSIGVARKGEHFFDAFPTPAPGPR